MLSKRRLATLTAAVGCVIAMAIGLERTPAARASAPEPDALQRVVGGSDFVHGVANLDKSVEFYQSAFGLQMISSIPPGGPPVGKPFYDKRMQALTNLGGGFFRSATFRIPDSKLTLTLIECTNGILMPQDRVGKARATDRGVSMLSLRVPDIDAAFKKIEATYEGEVLTTGSKPVGSQQKSVVIRDLDGFVVEVTQPDPAMPAEPPAAIVLTALNAESKVKFYRDILGFTLTTGEWDESKDVLNAVGENAGAVRRTLGNVPGTNIPFEIREYRGMRQKHGVATFPPQPGSGWLRFVVGDMDALVKTFLREHIYIASAAIQPITIEGARHLLIREPDGVFIELIEQTPKATASAR